MLGMHQAENAATALTAALQLRKRGWQRISFQSCLAGISSAGLQGRSEVRVSLLLVQGLPCAVSVVLCRPLSFTTC